MTDGDMLTLQIAAIGLLVKALAYEHPNRSDALRTYDQLCGQFLSSATFLTADEQSRQMFRNLLSELKEPLESSPLD